MRIKKKYVLLESNLLDTLNEFSPQEKRLLWVLNKEYGPHDYTTFDIWNSAAWLIELFEIPYDLAYELSTTYFYNGDKLFGDFQTYRKVQNSGQIFFKYMDDFIDNFKVNLKSKNPNGDEDIVGGVNVDFIDDVYGLHKSTVLDRDVIMWPHSRGFTLYIPIKVSEIGTYPNEFRFWVDDSTPRSIMVKVVFSEIKITIPEDDKLSYDGNPDIFHVNVNIRVGEGDYIENFIDLDVPIPKPLSKEKVNDVFSDIYKDIIEKIEKTKFKLPSGTTPIYLSNL